jgi:multiple sugar transport system permease protein
VGLDNYTAMFADPTFWQSLLRTVEYVVINIGIQMIVALLIAVLMQRLTQSTWLRSLVLAPYLVSNVVAAIVFLWILDTQLGIFNIFLQWIGFDPVSFWSSETWVIPTVALVNVWRHVGYTALLLFAGLQAIPEYLYEAARTEGAGEIQMFRRVTLPLLRPILALVLIMSIIGSFQVFDTVSVTTQGGPADASKVLQMYIYENAFGQYQFGYASALSVALLVILMIITFAQYKLSNAGESDLD